MLERDLAPLVAGILLLITVGYLFTRRWFWLSVSLVSAVACFAAAIGSAVAFMIPSAVIFFFLGVGLWYLAKVIYAPMYVSWLENLLNR
jgi:hypothetical protein